MEGVSDKNPCFSRQRLLERVLEDGFADVGIECRERVLNGSNLRVNWGMTRMTIKCKQTSKIWISVSQ